MAAQTSAPEPALPRRTQRWLQLAWLILIVPVAVLYFTGVVQSWSSPISFCEGQGLDCTEAAATPERVSSRLNPQQERGGTVCRRVLVMRNL